LTGKLASLFILENSPARKFTLEIIELLKNRGIVYEAIAYTTTSFSERLLPAAKSTLSSFGSSLARDSAKEANQSQRKTRNSKHTR